MTETPRLDLKRAVLQGVVLGLVAAGLFYLAYQLMLHNIYREVGDALRGATKRDDVRPAGNEPGPASGNGLGADEFGQSGNPAGAEPGDDGLEPGSSGGGS